MPQYHIVAADSRAARNGKFLEVVGRYEPLHNPMLIETQEDRLMYWLKTGARPTDTLRSLLQRSGMWLKWSLLKKGTDEATIASAMEKWQMAQAERRQRDEARKVRRLAARRKARKSAGGESAPAEATPAATQSGSA
jgi:small subunit ribosomal protein S16